MPERLKNSLGAIISPNVWSLNTAKFVTSPKPLFSEVCWIRVSAHIHCLRNDNGLPAMKTFFLFCWKRNCPNYGYFVCSKTFTPTFPAETSLVSKVANDAWLPSSFIAPVVLLWKTSRNVQSGFTRFKGTNCCLPGVTRKQGINLKD